jgi:hypothetical protein
MLDDSLLPVRHPLKRNSVVRPARGCDKQSYLIGKLAEPQSFDGTRFGQVVDISVGVGKCCDYLVMVPMFSALRTSFGSSM